MRSRRVFKLWVGLKISDQSRAGSHFNSQNTHSNFRNSQLAFYPEAQGTRDFAWSS